MQNRLGIVTVEGDIHRLPFSSTRICRQTMDRTIEETFGLGGTTCLHEFQPQVPQDLEQEFFLVRAEIALGFFL
jgi:hypothetical protein